MLTLAELSSPDRLAGRAPELAPEQAAAFGELAASLVESGRSEADAAHAIVVPGRIEVLGKHTDYAGGRSLTCATEQGLCLVAAGRQDRRVEILDVARAVGAGLALEPDLDAAAAGWERYARTVARRLARDFGGELAQGELRGADIALASDLPAAAGMGSSSALVVGLFQALAAVNGLERRPGYRAEISGPADLAGYLGAVESGRPFGALGSDLGVGTFGGSEDHTAILCSVAGRVGQYSYAPVRPERSIESPASHLFVIAACGVRARKTGPARDAYNRLALAAAAAARAWRRRTDRPEPDLASILASGPDALERLRAAIAAAGGSEFTPGELLDRLEHFRQESETLVPQAGDALEDGDLAVFGLVVDRSQHLAGKLLGNQIPETVALAEAARELGAAAASSFGAGFGGAVWALVEESEADEFAGSWLADYLERYPEHEEGALALVTRAAPAARELGS